jgi:ABC-type Co2+ transport system permease subunit
MHIEPGLVQGPKLLLGYATATTVGVYAMAQSVRAIRQNGPVSFAIRTGIAAVAVLVLFEVLPHFSGSVSEVHFIFGSTLFLLLGTAPAAIGLAAGLAFQGLFFAPSDLPQYGMNVTTLMVPLFVVSGLARKIISDGTRYLDIGYGQILALSTAYQAGVVAWVAFWVSYGNGFTLGNWEALGNYAVTYWPIVAIEPFVDVALLWLARTTKSTPEGLLSPRLYRAA